MPAPFSRLQLAAALIEYDNDPDDQDGKNRSAQESAIFAHLRRNPAARPDIHNRHSNHLGVSLPNENGTQDGRGSAMGTRRSRGSRGSLDALRNPFGTDSLYDEEREEEPEPDLEVDLSSWGLDQFIPKEKTRSKGKQKQSPAPTLATVSSKTISGGPNEFGEIPAAMAQSRSLGLRRPSMSSRMELDDNTYPQRRRAPSQSTLPPGTLEGGVPFPSGRRSPGYDQIGSQTNHMPRSHSRASIGSRGLLGEAQDDEDDERQRTFSQGTMGTFEHPDNPFAIQPPSHTSRFDPKAPVHARTVSHGSVGSRGLLDNFDAASTKSHESYARDRPYSVVELLRPKVLVMPSPLQPVGPHAEEAARDGFQLSKDGPPLPPGARPTSRRLSSNLDAVPNPSNSFIPNPTADLSFAQKVFRNTLVAGSSSGIEAASALPRATYDGEQIEFEPTIPPPEDNHLLYGITGQPRPARPAGKLFGKSLIDDLENRKQEMRSKQRMFKGDQRPSMMARESNRTSTLIDPATLNDRPNAKRNSSYGSQGSQNLLARHNSFKPLLNFDNDDKVPHSPVSPGADRIANSKSVFGVDTLWEKEMVKLRAIQEQERIDEEARTKAEEEEARAKIDKEKKKRKKKARVGEEEEVDEDDGLGVDAMPNSRISIEPPVLPDIKPTIHRTMPTVPDDESSEESDDDGQIVHQYVETSVAWHSDSEDDEGPRRTTGVGLRNPPQSQKQVRRMQQQHGSDSEEDLPLNVAMQRVATRTTKFADDSDEDEDRPLAQVLREPKSKSSMLDINFDNLNVRSGGDSEDEDSQPLGLRASRAMLSNPAMGEDDDKPLAFHPEQQRRTQYQLFAAAQQQQQHQSMMMQAQFQSSMFFNQPMMPSPYFAPPMMNHMAMMQPPMPIPSPPPIQDQSKFVSVDRWRRDVAIDGDH